MLITSKLHPLPKVQKASRENDRLLLKRTTAHGGKTPLGRKILNIGVPKRIVCLVKVTDTKKLPT